MAIHTIEKWTCDFCQQSTAMGTETCPPDGWLKITLENQFLDRSFFDKCLCHGCVAAIVAALERAKKRRGES